MGRLGAAAIAYARRGLYVFPLRPGGKEPLAAAAPHGVKDASCDPDEVAAWWEIYPDANIGLATGQKSGVLVLDVDGPEGEASLAALVAANTPLPDTPQQITGKGRHLFFAWPDGQHIGNSSRKLGPGLDIRGEGGYVLVAPSIHPNGSEYRWVRASGGASA